MNVLDENVVESQRQLLRSWRIRVRQIGHDIGRAGMQDEQIIPFLRRARRVTLFTRDLGFFDPKNRSRDYCIVCLAVGQHEVAVFVRGILRHPRLNTEAKRMGKIVRATHAGIRVLQTSVTEELKLGWEAGLSTTRGPISPQTTPRGRPTARGVSSRIPHRR